MPLDNQAAWTAIAFLLLCFGVPTSFGSHDFRSKGVQTRDLLQSGGDEDQVVRITEKNRGDFPNLLEGAKDGDQFVISVSELRLHKLVEINAAITVRGRNPENRPKIVCEGDGGLVVSAEGVVLKDYILSGCKGPAIQINNPAFADPFADPATLVNIPFQRVQISNVDFFDNRDEENGFHADGGALGISSGSNVTVTSCLFSNNTAQLGGGIHAQSRTVLQVINSTFDGNRARISGAGISTTAYRSAEGSPETSFMVSGCNFIGNVDEDGAADTSGLQLQGVGSSLEASEFLRFGTPQRGRQAA